MRARRREINIFNMSLLDILCGALGAFCFMMLVLLPYYKPPGSEADLQRTQKEVDEMMAELAKLKQSVTDPEAAKQMQELAQRLEAEIKQMQGQLNSTRSELAQAREQVNSLQQQNQQLATENQQLGTKARQLEARTPFLVMAGARDHSQELDLYLEDDHAAGQARNPPFDPAKNRHPRFWPGDIAAWATGGFATWVVRDSPPGIHYKIFVKLATEPARVRSTGVFGGVYGEGVAIKLPEFGLTPERPWAHVGTLTGLQGGKLEFQPAADLPKPPSAADRAADAERLREDIRRRLLEERARRQGASPAPATPAPQ